MKPNILFIMTDQHRYDAVSYGGQKMPATPCLDAVAEESVIFTNAYTPSPVCAPARAAIKSGMYPPGCGVIDNWVEFKTGTRLLTDRLSEIGYHTALVGKLHFVPHDKPYGFDYKKLNDAPYSTYANDHQYSKYVDWLKEVSFNGKNIDPVELFDADEEAFDEDIYKFCMGSDFRSEKEHDIPWTVEESIQFLDNRNKGKPFFLFTSFFGPHQPYMPPTPWKNMYSTEDIKLPENQFSNIEAHPIFHKSFGDIHKKLTEAFTKEDYKRIIAAYYGQISMVDHYIGKLFDKLKEQGLWDNTMIVFVSDHGDFMGAYDALFKGQMYDACCKVPFFIKPPNGEAEVGQREAIVSSLDIYSTILDVVGDISWKEGSIESRSLRSFFKGVDTTWDNHTYSIIGPDPDCNLTMLRRDHFKLMRLGQGEEPPVYELYDMRDSVVEIRNVYDDPHFYEMREVLKDELDGWWKQQKESYPKKVVSHKK